jgi:hypothetical protein
MRSWPGWMLADEARKNPGAFQQRLFLETLSELLPRFRRTVVVAAGQDLDISLFSGDPAPRAGSGPLRATPGEGGP